MSSGQQFARSHNRLCPKHANLRSTADHRATTGARCTRHAALRNQVLQKRFEYDALASKRITKEKSSATNPGQITVKTTKRGLAETTTRQDYEQHAEEHAPMESAERAKDKSERAKDKSERAKDTAERAKDKARIVEQTESQTAETSSDSAKSAEGKACTKTSEATPIPSRTSMRSSTRMALRETRSISLSPSKQAIQMCGSKVNVAHAASYRNVHAKDVAVGNGTGIDSTCSTRDDGVNKGCHNNSTRDREDCSSRASESTSETSSSSDCTQCGDPIVYDSYKCEKCTGVDALPTHANACSAPAEQPINPESHQLPIRCLTMQQGDALGFRPLVGGSTGGGYSKGPDEGTRGRRGAGPRCKHNARAVTCSRHADVAGPSLYQPTGGFSGRDAANKSGNGATGCRGRSNNPPDCRCGTKHSREGCNRTGGGDARNSGSGRFSTVTMVEYAIANDHSLSSNDLERIVASAECRREQLAKRAGGGRKAKQINCGCHDDDNNGDTLETKGCDIRKARNKCCAKKRKYANTTNNKIKRTKRKTRNKSKPVLSFMPLSEAIHLRKEMKYKKVCNFK